MKNSNRKAVPGKSSFDKIIKYVISACIIAGIVLQGGYFAPVYIGNTIILALLLLYNISRKQVIMTQVQKVISALVLLLFLMYALSSIISSGGLYKGFLESCKIFSFGMIILLIILEKDRDSLFYFKSIITGTLILASCGILMYLEIYSFQKGVIIIGKTARLQSFIQYANTAAVLFGSGAFLSCCFIVKTPILKDKLKYISILYILILSTFLTFSRASVFIFSALYIITVIFVKNYRLQLFTTFIMGFISALFLNICVVNGKILIATLLFAGMFLVVLLLNLLLFNFSDRKPKIYAYSGTLAVTMAAIPLFLTFGSNRLFKINILEGTLAERFIYWKDSLIAIKDHIFSGIGPGRWENFQFYYQTAQYDAKYIHNSFLQVFLDSGIIAFLAFLAIAILSIILASGNVLKTERNIRYHSPQYFLTVILLFIILHGLTDMDFSFTGLLNIFGLLIALAVSGESNKLDLKDFEKRLVTGFAFSILILTILLIPGQVFFNMARNAYFKDNMVLAEKYIRVSDLFRPKDDETAALHADITKDINGNTDNYVNMLLKAHTSEPYQPLYLKKIANVLMENNNPKTPEYLKKLLEAAPMVKENYTFASDCLQKLNSRNAIDKKQYEYYRESFRNIEHNAGYPN